MNDRQQLTVVVVLPLLGKKPKENFSGRHSIYI